MMQGSAFMVSMFFLMAFAAGELAKPQTVLLCYLVSKLQLAQ